jgi:hypothetical protein
MPQTKIYNNESDEPAGIQNNSAGIVSTCRLLWVLSSILEMWIAFDVTSLKILWASVIKETVNKKFWKEVNLQHSSNCLTIMYRLHCLTGVLHTLIFIVTSTTIVTVVKQWFQVWDSLLHKCGFNFHTTMVWLPWLPNILGVFVRLYLLCG